MRAILIFLERRRALAAVLAAGYVAITAWQHRIVNDAVLSLRGARDTATWDLDVNLVLAGPALIAAIWLIRLVVRHPARRVILAYGALTLALAYAGNRVLMALNTEIAHYIQYAILAILIFPIFGRLADALILATLCGIFDESVQYWVHYRDWGIYLDFNDCIINLFGAALGVLFVVALRGEAPDWPAARLGDLKRSPAVIAVAVVAAVCIVLWMAHGLVYVRTATTSSWAAVLNRGGPHVGFWTPVNYGRTFHVVRPLEAAVLLVGLSIPYLPLDWLVGKAMHGTEAVNAPAPAPALAVAD